MRLTELTHIGKIKEQYVQLRACGYDRENAIEKLLCAQEELSQEDCLTFWVGLADGLYAKKELTLEIAFQGLLALHRLLHSSQDITPGDIERRRKHYSQAPMPERKLGRPRKNVSSS